MAEEAAQCHQQTGTSPPAAHTITAKPVEIWWHYYIPEEDNQHNQPNTNPTPSYVWSVDYHPTQPRLLTCGCDGSIKIWNADEAFADKNDGEKNDVHIATLMLKKDDQPQGARWTPCGKMICSVHDNKLICLWKPIDLEEFNLPLSDDRQYNKEHWRVCKTFSAAVDNQTCDDDVVDVAFSPCGSYLITGSVSGAVIIHSMTGGKETSIFKDAHVPKCQGVAWDPWGDCAVSIGADKTMRVYRKSHNAKFDSRSYGKITIKDGEKTNTTYLFKGESASSFFRRAGWSPDGTMLAVPCGWVRNADADHKNCVYVYLRNNFSCPMLQLTVAGTASVLGAKFSPAFLEIPSVAAEDVDHLKAWGPTEYAMALATFTPDTVVIYTTNSPARHSSFTDLHYAAITDLTWAPSGQLIAVSSLDGFVSCIKLDNSLGMPIPVATVSAAQRPLLGAVLEKKFALQAKCEALMESVLKPQKHNTLKKRKVDKGKGLTSSAVTATSPTIDKGHGDESVERPIIEAETLAELDLS